MVELNQKFNSEDVEPSGNNFEPIPTDWYPAIIESDEQKPTKAAERGENKDWYINMTFCIVGDKYANRKIFKMLNLQNQSQTAMEIAYRDLSAICHAVGKSVISSTNELHNLPMLVHVKMIPAVLNPDGSEKYATKNEINGFKNLQEVKPNSNTPQATVQQNQQAPTTNNPADVPAVSTEVAAKPPWES